jgi:hypothetical protein
VGVRPRGPGQGVPLRQGRRRELQTGESQLGLGELLQYNSGINIIINPHLPRSMQHGHNQTSQT